MMISVAFILMHFCFTSGFQYPLIGRHLDLSVCGGCGTVARTYWNSERKMQAIVYKVTKALIA